MKCAIVNCEAGGTNPVFYRGVALAVMCEPHADRFQRDVIGGEGHIFRDDFGQRGWISGDVSEPTTAGFGAKP